MLLVIFFSSVKLVYFKQFFCLLCIQLLVHVRVAFLFLLCLLTKPYHFGVNWPPTLCENKDWVHFFTLKFECHKKYNKLLLCNSENGIIVWCKKTMQNGVYVLFFSRIKTCFLSKNPKNGYKKTKKTGRLGFIKKTGFSQPLSPFNPFLWFSLDRTIRNKSRHYQFGWVCAAHPEYSSLVLKKLRITDIWIRKRCWKTSFEILNPCSMC